MIRSYLLFRLFETASFSTRCYIDRYANQLTFAPNSYGQCQITSDISAAFRTFKSEQLTNPFPLSRLLRSLTDTYKLLEANKKRKFMNILFENINRSPQFDSPHSLASALTGPVSVSNYPFTTFLHVIALHPRGLEFVLELKIDLKFIKSSLGSQNETADQLNQLESSLHDVITLWSRGSFLTFKLITTKTPKELLGNIMRSEAVHPVSGEEELYRRVTSGRCYAVTHNQLSPNLPLSMVYCAPITYFPTAIQPILAAAGFEPNNLDSPTTACFYSISNAHTGFGGTEVSYQLIKFAVSSLRHKFPTIHTFVTLSPIPQFRQWLTSNNRTFRSQLTDYSPIERRELLRECACYLVTAKRGRRALDPVANFHLKNGATLRKINWLANTSQRGIAQSLGIMANYQYDLETLEANRTSYLSEGVISASEEVTSLLQ